MKSGTGTDRYLLWAGLYLAFVVYGSLIPFKFQPIPLMEALTRFAHTPYLNLGVEHRADWIANILLYIPLAGLLTAAFSASTQPREAAVKAFSWCLALAIGLEFTQLFFPRRTVSLNDMIAEVLGSGLGISFWLLIGHRFENIRQAVSMAGGRTRQTLLALYALAYLGFAFFPLDFLISIHELQEQLEGGNVGLWQAAHGCSRRMSCSGTRAMEVFAAVPLGIGLGLWVPGLRRPGEWIGIAATTVALGFGIEFLQLFTASNISQGVSGLSRAVGLALGYVLYRRAHYDWPARCHRALQQPSRVMLLASAYTASTLFLTAAGKGPWLDFATVKARLVNLHWLPFWNHYHTSETRALESLVLNFAFHAPVGLFVYAAGRSASPRRKKLTAALAAALWGLCLEGAKTSLREARPDPTNLLIAVAAALCGYWLAARLLSAEERAASRPSSPEGLE